MACTDMTIRLEVDGLATGSSASTKSRSLELLLVLHTLLGAAVLQRTNECSSSGRARCAVRPPVGRPHPHASRPCGRQGGGLSSRRTEPASLHSRMCRLTYIRVLYHGSWGLGANIPSSIKQTTISSLKNALVL